MMYENNPTIEDRADADAAWKDFIDDPLKSPSRPVNILDIYQAFTPTTAVYPYEYSMPYLIAGLAEEAGEVAGKYKKAVRKNGTGDPAEFSLLEWEKFVDVMEKEMGDVLWYLSEIHNYLELDMTSTLVRNRDKLIDRQNRNVIVGEGDNR